MKKALASLAVLTILTALLAGPCSAQGGPPPTFMGIDQYSVLYDNFAQYQQAVIPALTRVTDDGDKEILMNTFCMANNIIVMLDHLSRTIGFIYGASSQNDAAADNAGTRLMCVFYDYDMVTLQNYANLLNQAVSQTTGETQQFSSTLLQNVAALQQLMAAQAQIECTQ